MALARVARTGSIDADAKFARTGGPLKGATTPTKTTLDLRKPGPLSKQPAQATSAPRDRGGAVDGVTSV